MKTTLEIDDDLYREAKAVAALTGRKMKDLVGEGLRLMIRQQPAADASVRALGCLKKELRGRSVEQLVDEIRGPVKLPAVGRKRS